MIGSRTTFSNVNMFRPDPFCALVMSDLKRSAKTKMSVPKPQSISFQMARFSAIIVFTISLLMFLSNFIITIIPEKVEVVNLNREIIGYVRLPVRTEEYGLIFFSFVVLSFFQIWMLSLISKKE
jgi:hypothetical protein